MMQYFIYILVFGLGVFVAFLIDGWLTRRIRYSGTIVITKSPAKTLFSLEMSEDPLPLEFKKAVIFKVEVRDVPSDDDEGLGPIEVE